TARPSNDLVRPSARITRSPKIGEPTAGVMSSTRSSPLSGRYWSAPSRDDRLERDPCCERGYGDRDRRRDAPLPADGGSRAGRRNGGGILLAGTEHDKDASELGRMQTAAIGVAPRPFGRGQLAVGLGLDHAGCQGADDGVVDG